MEKNIIPQVPLSTLLAKYDGVTAQVNTEALGLPVVIKCLLQHAAGSRKRFSIVRLPKYLVFQIKRFTKNNFTVEKNPTIVNFPIKNLDMMDC